MKPPPMLLPNLEASPVVVPVRREAGCSQDAGGVMLAFRPARRLGVQTREDGAHRERLRARRNVDPREDAIVRRVDLDAGLVRFH